MADRRPAGEREYNPLDDSQDLISRVMTGKGAQIHEERAAAKKEELARSAEKVVELRKPIQNLSDDKQEKVEQTQKSASLKEEAVVFKFSVPRSDFVAAKRIVGMLEGELNARVDLSNLGRGWLTRLITAEKEIMEAAKHQQKIKTPNSRDPLQIAEVDHALAVIQSVAFRRAEPVK
jgi:hypothetical protein